EQTLQFMGDEHELIGNKINDPSEPGIYTKLILPNGIQLTFGQVIALAGDFFALPNAPIITVHGKGDGKKPCRWGGKKPFPGGRVKPIPGCENKPYPGGRKNPYPVGGNKPFPGGGKRPYPGGRKKPYLDLMTERVPYDAFKTGTVKATPDERKRFMGAYATLASVPRKSIEKQVATLVTMIGEDLLVRRYHNGTLHTNAQYAYVTNGRMLKLAAINFDHFEPQAPRAYLVGHQLAMEKAREAAKEKDPDMHKEENVERVSLYRCFCLSLSHRLFLKRSYE
ncbi:Hypothetical predicted protein, partial [Paramuricea clavata]